MRENVSRAHQRDIVLYFLFSNNDMLVANISKRKIMEKFFGFSCNLIHNSDVIGLNGVSRDGVCTSYTVVTRWDQIGLGCGVNAH